MTHAAAVVSAGSQSPLPRSLKLFWGLGVLGPLTVMYLFGTQALVYLTDFAGIAPAVAGVILFVVKVLDWVADVAVGVLSDRTHTRWGRRRPWMLAGAILLATACALMFQVHTMFPHNVLPVSAALMLVLYTGFSMATIPQLAMLAEMTGGYHERTSLAGYSYFFGMLASALGVSLAPALILWFGGGAPGYRTMGLTLAAVPLIAGIACVRGTRAAPVMRRAARSRVNIRDWVASLAGNRPLVVLIAVKALAVFGAACVSTSMIYFTLHVVKLGQSGMIFYGLCVLAGNAVGLLTSLQLARRFPKHVILAVALVELGCAALSFGVPGTAGDTALFCLRSVAFGIGQAIVLMMLQSMMADVIQWDYVLCGRAREGMLSSLVAVVQKSAPAFSALLVGFTLSLGGYVGGRPGAPQSPEAAHAIFLAVSIIPGIILLLAAIPMALLYDLTEAKLHGAPGTSVPVPIAARPSGPLPSQEKNYE